MRIGGLQRLTLIDYPGRIAAIVFTQGCNLRCGYCHNPELVVADRRGPVIPEESVLEFFGKRRTYLQGVVISGGEPTLQSDLPDFLKKVKQLGFAVKLDTNGTLPDVLERIIRDRLVDYIAMDIKTSLEKYDRIAGVSCPVENIRKSIRLIRHAGVEFEFRTTVVKPFCDAEDLKKIKGLIAPTDPYRIQQFQPGAKILDPGLLQENHYSDHDIEELRSGFANS